MQKSINLHHQLIIFGVPFLLLAFLVVLMKSPSLALNDRLSFAITADLLLTVPLIYFLLIRKTRVPKTTVIPIMLAGLLLGSYFLPGESQIYLNLFKTWALPVIEVLFLTFVVLKVRRAIKIYRELSGSTPDFFNTLKSVCYEVLPKKLVFAFATEVAVIYYGFINWRSRPLQENEFTYHRKSGTPTLFYIFIYIIGIEAVALHFLLSLWSSIAAWILTILSIYTAIQVFGFAKSLSKRPLAINNNSLTLTYGILNEVEIPFSDIKNIELSWKSLKKDSLTKTLSPLGEMESHNMIIYLNKVKELTGLYGFKKKFKVLALHIDEPTAFMDKLRELQENL